MRGGPTFLLAAAADRGAANGSAQLFLELNRAGAVAEMHMYQKGRHGFGAKRPRPKVNERHAGGAGLIERGEGGVFLSGIPRTGQPNWGTQASGPDPTTVPTEPAPGQRAPGQFEREFLRGRDRIIRDDSVDEADRRRP